MTVARPAVVLSPRQRRIVTAYTRAEKRGKDWCVFLVVGPQTFMVSALDSADDAKWMRAMLAKALDRIVGEMQ